MDEITQEDFQYISPQITRELTSPLSPKRPKTEHTMANLQVLLAYQKATGSPSSLRTWQRTAGLECTAEFGNEQQDTGFIVTPVTKLTASNADNAHTGSSKACCIDAERHFLFLMKNKEPQVTEKDKLISYPLDTGEGLAEPHTSKDTDTSSHPDCKELAESLEDEPPCGYNHPACNGEDGRQAGNRVSKIQAFIHCSSDEEFKYQSDCTHGDELHETGFCNTFGQSAVAMESHPETYENGYGENILFREETKEGNGPISSSDYAHIKSFYSNPEDEPSGDLAECVKNEEKVLELLNCENENLVVDDGETKGQIDKKDLCKNLIPTSNECAKGSVSYNVVLARNIANENVSLGAVVFCAAKGEHAAGKMTAKAQREMADHTTESPIPVRTSQEPAEGDNDVGPLSVIDPAIWSETRRGAEEKHCNSESAADAELSPSVKVYEMEMPLPLCSDIMPSHDVSAPDQTWQSNHHCRTQKCKGEKEDLCQSYAEPQACPITTNETQKTIGCCLWKSSPSSSPNLSPTGNGRQECHETVGHELREHSLPDVFPVSLDHLTTQEVVYLKIESGRKDNVTEITKRAEIHFEGERRTNEQKENSVDLQDKCVQLNDKRTEDTTEITTVDCVCGLAVDEISNYGNRFTHTEEELGDDLDHSYCAVVFVKEGTTEENERKQTDVHANPDILATSENGYPQPSPQKEDMTKASPDDGISEGTEGQRSPSSHQLTLVSQLEQGNQLNCYSDYQPKAERFIVENKDDPLAFTFPATSDAVVSAPHELTPSQEAYNPTVLNRCDRFSPLPSAITFCDNVLGFLDTFERKQLSLDDDYDVLTSPPEQLLKTLQQQLHYSTPESESNREEEEVPVAVDVEVEHLEHDTKTMANGIVSGDYGFNELLNFFSEAHFTAPRWPEQQPKSESAWCSSECIQSDFNPQSISSSESHSPDSDTSDRPKFEMKKQFDIVLKELNLYFDISKSEFVSDSRAVSPEQPSQVAEALMDTSSCESPKLRHRGDTSSDEEVRNLDPCGGGPLIPCTSGTSEGEQEVPLGSQLCREASINTPEEHREPQGTEKRRKMWSPSFTCRPFLEQLSHRPPEQTRRLEPLRTCTRPIRVGLSKRAKTKHLHHLHPYK